MNIWKLPNDNTHEHVTTTLSPDLLHHADQSTQEPELNTRNNISVSVFNEIQSCNKNDQDVEMQKKHFFFWSSNQFSVNHFVKVDPINLRSCPYYYDWAIILKPCGLTTITIYVNTIKSYQGLKIIFISSNWCRQGLDED